MKAPHFCHQSAVRVRHLGNTVRPLLACDTITAGLPYCCRPASLLERYGHRYVTSSMHSANTKCIYDCINNTRFFCFEGFEEDIYSRSLTHHLPLAGALGFHGEVKACLGSCLTLVKFVCVVQSAGSIHLFITKRFFWAKSTALTSGNPGSGPSTLEPIPYNLLTTLFISRRT
jgi:hypothetical protein